MMKILERLQGDCIDDTLILCFSIKRAFQIGAKLPKLGEMASNLTELFHDEQIVFLVHHLLVIGSFGYIISLGLCVWAFSHFKLPFELAASPIDFRLRFKSEVYR